MSQTLREHWRIGLLAGLIVAAGLVTAPAGADERVLEPGKWYPSLESGLNITQSSYSNNWAGGDKGSVVWSWIANGTLENQLDPKVNWYNILKLAYGQTHQQRVRAGERYWDRPEKSTDLIDFETIFRFTLGGYVDPFVSGRFESQFHDVSDSLGRGLTLNPVRFKETAGIAKQWINEEERSLLSRLGFTFRQTSRLSFTTADPADDSTVRETTNDGGIELINDYKTKILDDRVTWTSKLSFYQPVFYSGKSDLEDVTEDTLQARGVDLDVAKFTTTMDIDWENIFTTQITKLISVNLYVRWLYDKYDNSVKPEIGDNGSMLNAKAVSAAIRKAGQFKETLSIGITYRFL